MDRADGIPEAVSQYSVPFAMDQFFGAYLHQDWPFEAEDWEGIVDQYCASPTRTPEQLRTLADQIDELIATCTESELPSVILNMGAFYDPRPQLTYTAWLQQVAARIREHAAD